MTSETPRDRRSGAVGRVRPEVRSPGCALSGVRAPANKRAQGRQGALQAPGARAACVGVVQAADSSARPSSASNPRAPWRGPSAPHGLRRIGRRAAAAARGRREAQSTGTRRRSPAIPAARPASHIANVPGSGTGVATKLAPPPGV